MNVGARDGNRATALRVLIAAPEPALTSSLREDLGELGFSVCAIAHDAHGAVAAGVSEDPDLCVLAAELPGSAVVATAEITHLAPRTRIVILGPVGDEDDCVTYLVAGASGYLDRNIERGALAVALRAAAAGEALLSAVAQQRLLEELRRDLPDLR